jgi:hypothetical protein
VQEYIPRLGRLPLVRDHALQWQPALPRGTQAVRLPDESASEDHLLAEEAEQVAANLRALYAKWDGTMSGHGGGMLSYSEREERTSQAVADMLAEYQSVYSARTLALVDRLVARGVLDVKRGRSLERRRHFPPQSRREPPSYARQRGVCGKQTHRPRHP